MDHVQPNLILPTTSALPADQPKLLLLDGHSLAFRAFYALPPEGFQAPNGQHTNALYGFLSMLLTLIDDHKPTHLVAAFDEHGPTFRSEEFPEYKAQRPSTPEPFIGQVELIRSALTALGVPTVSYPRFEADDIIATLATQAKSEGIPAYICTGDRDSFQLVDDGITVLYTLKGVRNLATFDAAAVEEKYGVTPRQYPDLAALRGDTSDNMPGVPGVGPKTAQKWISQYGSLDALVENMDSIKGKVGENLRTHIDDVLLARKITEMVRDLDIVDTIDQLRLHAVDGVGLDHFFDSVGFGANLRTRVRGIMQVEQDAGGGAEPAQSVDFPVVELADGQDGQLAQWLDEYVYQPAGKGEPAAQRVISIALELRDAIFSDDLAIAIHVGNVAAVEVVATRATLLIPALGMLEAEDRTRLEQLFADETIPFVVSNLKEALFTCREYGLDLKGVLHDCALLHYVRTASAVTESRGELVAAAVDQWDQVRELIESLNADHMLSVYEQIELPLSGVLFDMESAGIGVDLVELDSLLKEYGEKSAGYAQSARQIAGDESLNLNSPKQLQKVLFEDLALPKTKKTKTGYSTAAKELEGLAVDHPHPFLDNLLAYREVQKLVQIVEGLASAVKDDGKIHTTYQQMVTSTGRLSSVEPNLQNIPIRSDLGRRIRSVFVPSSGFDCLLTADYSQIEMRVMAHLSGDQGIIEAFRSGEDLHNYVGSKVFEVPVDEVTPELRRRVKAMSYGLVYGLSEFGLSQQLGIPVREAKDIMRMYFARFGGVKAYLDSVVETARQTGYTETMFGRRRYLPELTSLVRQDRENAERAALNAPIQGTAADIIKVAMLRVDRALKEQGLASRMLLQVHDELVLEVAEGELDAVKEIVVREMDGAITLAVPLEVSVGVGRNWEAAAH